MDHRGGAAGQVHVSGNCANNSEKAEKKIKLKGHDDEFVYKWREDIMLQDLQGQSPHRRIPRRHEAGEEWFESDIRYHIE